MNEFEVSRGYAAAGVPQVEIAGNELFILRWGIENNIVDGEVQGVKFYGCTFKGIPAFGVLVDMMIVASTQSVTSWLSCVSVIANPKSLQPITSLPISARQRHASCWDW